jgi:hypothetical protein
VPNDYKKLVADCVSFQNVKNWLRAVDDTLVFNLKFNPLKPAILPMSLLIT